MVRHLRYFENIMYNYVIFVKFNPHIYKSNMVNLLHSSLLFWGIHIHFQKKGSGVDIPHIILFNIT